MELAYLQLCIQVVVKGLAKEQTNVSMKRNHVNVTVSRAQCPYGETRQHTQ